MAPAFSAPEEGGAWAIKCRLIVIEVFRFHDRDMTFIMCRRHCLIDAVRNKNRFKGSGPLKASSQEDEVLMP